MANALGMRCELISTNVALKNYSFHDTKVGKIKEKMFILKINSAYSCEEDINVSERFNLVANKKHKLCPKNQN